MATGKERKSFGNRKHHIMKRINQAILSLFPQHAPRSLWWLFSPEIRPYNVVVNTRSVQKNLSALCEFMITWFTHFNVNEIEKKCTIPICNYNFILYHLSTHFRFKRSCFNVIGIPSASEFPSIIVVIFSMCTW